MLQSAKKLMADKGILSSINVKPGATAEVGSNFMYLVKLAG
jgi:hypothetical protein